MSGHVKFKIMGVALNLGGTSIDNVLVPMKALRSCITYHARKQVAGHTPLSARTPIR